MEEANERIKAADAQKVATVDKRLQRAIPPARKTYQDAMTSMVDQVNKYAGEAARQYADVLRQEADWLMDKLKAGHEARIVAWSGKDDSILRRKAHLVGEFEKPLYAARSQAISDVRYALAKPDHGLQWWRRASTRDRLIGFVLGVAATIVGRILIGLLGLSQ